MKTMTYEEVVELLNTQTEDVVKLSCFFSFCSGTPEYKHSTRGHYFCEPHAVQDYTGSNLVVVKGSK